MQSKGDKKSSKKINETLAKYSKEDDCDCRDPCNQPYVVPSDCGFKLNIRAPKCLLKNEEYLELYKRLYNSILAYDLDTALASMIQANNDTAYDNFISLLEAAFVTVTFGTASPRILVTESDGTVVVDSSKAKNPGSATQFTSANSLNNWKTKPFFAFAGGSTLPPNLNYNAVNENHHSRIAVLQTQLYQDGVGYETKYSTSTGTNQAYVAVRLGPYLNNYGSIRLSVNI